MISVLSPTERYRKTWLITPIVAVALISLSGCGATDKTMETTVEPAPIDAGPIDTSLVPDNISAAEPEEVAAVIEVTVTDQTASSSGQNEMRQAESHVHGTANLAMALDGAMISVEFESPLYNLVGFEHTPETDAQMAAYEKAEAALLKPSTLFQFNPEAACISDLVNTVNLRSEAQHNHGHGHDHDSHHHHDDHRHDDDHDHAHKDALLTYSFTCQSPDRLQWVDVGLFTAFNKLAEIELVYLGPSQQISESLKPNSDRIQLVD